MKIGLVKGTVTATLKDPQLVGGKLLLTDIVDAKGKVLEAALVAVDTVGAGVGDRVVIVTGSAARQPAGVAGQPVDATIVGVVDGLSVTE